LFGSRRSGFAGGLCFRGAAGHLIVGDVFVGSAPVAVAVAVVLFLVLLIHLRDFAAGVSGVLVLLLRLFFFFAVV